MGHQHVRILATTCKFRRQITIKLIPEIMSYDLPLVASTYVCTYNGHEIASSRKMRGSYVGSANIL